MADTREIEKLIRALEKIQRNEEAAKKVVETVHAKVAERIFNESGTKDINGASLGRYSKSYLRHRIKEAKGSNPRVKLQFTTAMSNDFYVVTLPAKRGKFRFGSGFKNSINYKKSIWVEKTYDKVDKIFALSEQEEKLFFNLTEKYIQNALD